MPTRSKSMPYTTEPDGYLEPKIGRTGHSSQPAITVIEQFNKIVAAFPSRPAMGLKRPVNGKVGIHKMISTTQLKLPYPQISLKLPI